MENKEYCKAAAQVVDEQLTTNPTLGVPVDPDVADFMGAFTEDAVALADMVDDLLLSVNDQGEVSYDG